MTKTIKFNLICDGNPVRTIEDLQDNFSIEDVLAYYDNGLLARWLAVCGYDEQLAAVGAIKADEPMEIIKQLIKIFDIEVDNAKVEEGIYILQYRNERQKQLQLFAEQKSKAVGIIDDYIQKYEKLVKDIFENYNDVALIKANIAEIMNNYADLFEYNHRELFWNWRYNNRWVAIMCLLLNEKSRYYFLSVEVEVKEDGEIIWDIDSGDNKDKKAMYDEICKIVGEFTYGDDKHATMMADYVRTFAGETDGYWKNLEEKGKLYMIISMDQGDYVRAANDAGGDMSSKDINNKFVIVDGIDYKSNNASHKLVYMEV